MTCDAIIEELRGLNEDHFYRNPSIGIGHLYRLTDALKELPSPERAIPELFAVMERLAGSDLGSPGPIIHTLERMDYLPELEASLGRRPTTYTIWMVGRILNTDLSPERRQHYLDLLARVAENPEASEGARDWALDTIKEKGGSPR